MLLVIIGIAVCILLCSPRNAANELKEFEAFKKDSAMMLNQIDLAFENGNYESMLQFVQSLENKYKFGYDQNDLIESFLNAKRMEAEFLNNDVFALCPTSPIPKTLD